MFEAADLLSRARTVISESAPRDFQFELFEMLFNGDDLFAIGAGLATHRALTREGLEDLADLPVRGIATRVARLAREARAVYERSSAHTSTNDLVRTVRDLELWAQSNRSQVLWLDDEHLAVRSGVLARVAPEVSVRRLAIRGWLEMEPGLGGLRRVNGTPMVCIRLGQVEQLDETESASATPDLSKAFEWARAHPGDVVKTKTRLCMPRKAFEGVDLDRLSGLGWLDEEPMRCHGRRVQVGTRQLSLICLRLDVPAVSALWESTPEPARRSGSDSHARALLAWLRIRAPRFRRYGLLDDSRLRTNASELDRDLPGVDYRPWLSCPIDEVGRVVIRLDHPDLAPLWLRSVSP